MNYPHPSPHDEPGVDPHFEQRLGNMLEHRAGAVSATPNLQRVLGDANRSVRRATPSRTAYLGSVAAALLLVASMGLVLTRSGGGASTDAAHGGGAGNGTPSTTDGLAPIPLPERCDDDRDGGSGTTLCGHDSLAVDSDGFTTTTAPESPDTDCREATVAGNITATTCGPATEATPIPDGMAPCPDGDESDADCLDESGDDGTTISTESRCPAGQTFTDGECVSDPTADPTPTSVPVPCPAGEVYRDGGCYPPATGTITTTVTTGDCVATTVPGATTATTCAPNGDEPTDTTGTAHTSPTVDPNTGECPAGYYEHNGSCQPPTTGTAQNHSTTAAG